MKLNLTKTTIMLEEEVIKALKELADKKKMSMAALIRWIIDENLKKEEK